MLKNLGGRVVTLTEQNIPFAVLIAVNRENVLCCLVKQAHPEASKPLGITRPIYRIGRVIRYHTNTPFYIYFSKNISIEFLNMLHTLRLFFSSKCRLFHNATFFGSCIVCILHTGCAKI
jgi:hypothetical protein